MIDTTKIDFDALAEIVSAVQAREKYTSAVSIARSSGWKVTKNGWICPDCVRRIQEEKKCRKS